MDKTYEEREKEMLAFYTVSHQKIMVHANKSFHSNKFTLLSFNSSGVVIDMQEISEHVANYLLAFGIKRLE